MTKLDWSKTKSSVTPQPLSATGREKRTYARQVALKEFQDEHDLSCFACRRHEPGAIAKTGWKNGKPWLLCASCARKGKPRKR